MIRVIAGIYDMLVTEIAGSKRLILMEAREHAPFQDVRKEATIPPIRASFYSYLRPINVLPKSYEGLMMCKEMIEHIVFTFQ